MSLLDYKITDQSVQGVYVQSQPDRLTGTPQQNKAAFDAYPALIRKQFNLLVDALGGTTAAGEIPIQSINGVQAQNVQQALAAIQQNLTAYINKLKATTGAAEVGVSTISGISAGNVQKALEGLRAIQITLDSNIQKLMSANGAEAVGVNKISGMQAQNVQKALEELRQAIDDSVSGIIPGGSITADMLADDVNEILENKLSMPVEIRNNADLNTYRIPGMYFCPTDAAAATVQNCPLPYGFALLVEKNLSNHVIQTIKFWRNSAAYSNVTTYMRRTYPTPSEWVLISTATQPQEIPLPITDGYAQQSYQNTCYKTQDGRVYASFCITKGNTKFDTYEIFATLPIGHRPKSKIVRNVGGDGIIYGNGIVAIEIQINPNGEMSFYTLEKDINWVFGEISFLASE